MGILLTLFCGICVQGIRQSKSIGNPVDQYMYMLIVGKCGTLLLVILLIIVFGLGIGILIGYCCVKNKKGTCTVCCLSALLILLLFIILRER